MHQHKLTEQTQTSILTKLYKTYQTTSSVLRWICQFTILPYFSRQKSVLRLDTNLLFSPFFRDWPCNDARFFCGAESPAAQLRWQGTALQRSMAALNWTATPRHQDFSPQLGEIRTSESSFIPTRIPQFGHWIALDWPSHARIRIDHMPRGPSSPIPWDSWIDLRQLTVAKCRWFSLWWSFRAPQFFLFSGYDLSPPNDYIYNAQCSHGCPFPIIVP